MKITALLFLWFLGFQTTAMALEPEEIKAAYFQSYTSEQAGKYQEAIEALEPVLSAYSTAYTVNLRSGWLYYLKGDYASSIQYYDRAIRAERGSVEVLLGKTYPLMALKKYDDVAIVLHQIRSIDRNNYTANLKLAQVFILKEKYLLAEQILYAMLKLYPTDVSFLSELATVKSAKGEKDTAAQLYHDIIVLDPTNKTASAALAKAQA